MYNNINIEIFFQPIILSITKHIQGVEALLRATNKEGKNITPYNLLSVVEKKGDLYNFNKHLIELSIKKFSKYKKKIPLLFLNLESIFIINDFEETDNIILELCNKYNIKTSNVVLEVKENSIENQDMLFSFCNKYKELGFKIALDDFGTGSSTYDRINIVSPDIIKIDRCLISSENNKNSFINKQIVKSIVDIGNTIGATILAEGVETSEDVTNSLSLGISLYQGWYFEKALKKINNFDYSEKMLQPLNLLRSIKQKSIFKRAGIINKSIEFINTIKGEFNSSDYNEFKDYVLKTVSQTGYPLKEIFFIDGESQVQIDNIIYIENVSPRDNIYNTDKGYDHSFEDYFAENHNLISVELSETKMSSVYSENVYDFHKTISINNQKIIVVLKIGEFK